MSETPRTDETLKFIRDQIVKDSATLVQDHPFYVLDVLGNLGRRLERELSAERQKREQAERNEAGIRELINVYNCGGWTDALGPMKRALEAERERDESRAECERLRKWIDAMNSSAAIDAARGKKS